jgi:ABC-2 type transport system permease protein
MSQRTTVAPDQRAPQQESAVAVSAGGAARQNTLRNIGLIIKHEYKKRVSQRSFRISTIIILVFIVIAAFIPTIIQLIAAHSNSQTKITIVNNAGAIDGLNGDALAGYFKTTLKGTNGTGGTTSPATGKSSS